MTYLVLRLNQLGWGDLLHGLPRTPWFYVIFVLMYFTLPMTETVAYSLIWKRPTLELLPAMLRKRVYNRELVGFTGELSLYVWARRAVDGATNRVFHAVKDNTIVASLASVGFATTVLVILLVTGTVSLPPSSSTTIAAGDELFTIGKRNSIIDLNTI